MELPGPSTKYCLSFNNTMRLLETKNFRSPQSFGMSPCTSKNQLDNGGQVCVPKEKPPKTWKAMRIAIIKQFLPSDAKDKVLTKWRSLRMQPQDAIQRYIDKFWELHLKATVTVYKKIDFVKQKQQFCAGLSEEVSEYVNSQRPKTISAVIHHTIVASKIHCKE